MSLLDATSPFRNIIVSAHCLQCDKACVWRPGTPSDYPRLTFCRSCGHIAIPTGATSIRRLTQGELAELQSLPYWPRFRHLKLDAVRRRVRAAYWG